MRQNIAEELVSITEDCLYRTITVSDVHTDCEIMTYQVRSSNKINQLVKENSHENI